MNPDNVKIMKEHRIIQKSAHKLMPCLLYNGRTVTFGYVSFTVELDLMTHTDGDIKELDVGVARIIQIGQ